MKKLSFFLLLLLLIFISCLFADKIAAFTGFLNPETIVMDSEQIYITEGARIFIYSMKDFKLITKFGREGEGPREFKGKPEIDVQQDTILVNSIARVSFFSKSGRYLKEVNNIVSGQRFKPLGNRFVGYNFFVDKNGKHYSTINIYDSKFVKIKEVYRHESIVQAGKGWKLFARTYLRPLVCDNKIIVSGEKEFIIYVFDGHGNRLFTINRKYKRVRFTEEHKKRVLHLYKTRPTTAPEYDWWEKNIHFPDYFPAIRSISTADRKIYVRTYKEIENKSEFFVFETNGNLLKHIFLPIAKSSAKNAYPYIRDSSPYTFKNGNLYQLIENEDTETYELHVTGIK